MKIDFEHREAAFRSDVIFLKSSIFLLRVTIWGRTVSLEIKLSSSVFDFRSIAEEFSIMVKSFRKNCAKKCQKRPWNAIEVCFSQLHTHSKHLLFDFYSLCIIIKLIRKIYGNFFWDLIFLVKVTPKNCPLKVWKSYKNH